MVYSWAYRHLGWFISWPPNGWKLVISVEWVMLTIHRQFEEDRKVHHQWRGNFAVLGGPHHICGPWSPDSLLNHGLILGPCWGEWTDAGSPTCKTACWVGSLVFDTHLNASNENPTATKKCAICSTYNGWLCCFSSSKTLGRNWIVIYRKVQDNKHMYPPKQESESEDLDDLAKLDYIISKDRKNSAKHSPAGSIL